MTNATGVIARRRARYNCLLLCLIVSFLISGPSQASVAEDGRRTESSRDARSVTEITQRAAVCSSQPDGEWAMLPQRKAPGPRSYHAAVWTGREMLVWGGGHLVRDDLGDPRSVTYGVPYGDGGAYDPVADSWRPISSVGAPGPHFRPLAVWTGREMLIWGSYSTQPDGGRYDPATDSWKSISGEGAPPPNVAAVAVAWSGAEMLVITASTPGNVDPTDNMFDLARYDPTADAWRGAAPLPLVGLSLAAVAWTGTHLLVLGEQLLPYGSGRPFTPEMVGALWDPETDTWTVTSTDGAPGHRSTGVAGAWTGREMVIWSGRDRFGVDPIFYPDDGGAYDPVADGWRELPTEGAPSVRAEALTVWSGRELLIWSGRPPRTEPVVRPLEDGAAFDPATGIWRALPPAPVPGRLFGTAVWAGDRMIVFGGGGGGGFIGQGPEVNTGAAYIPPCSAAPGATETVVEQVSRQTQTSALTVCSGQPDGEWAMLPQREAPGPRRYHAAVWTGREMLVWGGGQEVRGELGDLSRFVSYGDGGAYDPVADSWRPISSVGAPGRRNRPLAVWTGKEMLIWGGYGAEPPGGRYDPLTDRWSPIAAGGPPTGHGLGAAVWTGREMVVLTGMPGLDHPRLGGMTYLYRYDPAVDAWATAEPLPHDGFSLAAIAWTGTHLLVLGEQILPYGSGRPFTPEMVGALWDPETDTWTVTSTDGAPGHRSTGVAGAWTGREMVIWSGRNPFGVDPIFYRDDGGAYDPESDGWRELPTEGAPSVRAEALTVWSGRELLIWSGQPPRTEPVVRPLEDGAAFDPATGIWRALPPAPVPGRLSGTAVWAGDRMIVFGGGGGGGLIGQGPEVNTGAAYIPPC